MSLENMASASNEKRQQHILELRREFNHLRIVTVRDAMQYFGYQRQTILRWAKDGHIPLIIDNQTTAVPLTLQNAPVDCPTTDPGEIFMQHLKRL